MARLEIKNIKINTVELSVDKEFENLLPRARPQEMSLVINGPAPAFANALRRTILGELTVRALQCDPSGVESNDPTIMCDFIADRLMLLPIGQQTALDATYSLHAVNSTHEVIDVWTSEIQPAGKSSPKLDCNNMVLCSIRPGKYINIKGIKVAEGTCWQHGRYTVAHSVISRPVVPMKNAMDGLDFIYKLGADETIAQGLTAALRAPMEKSTTEVLPREHILSFQTNSTMDAKEILLRACDTIIDMAAKVPKAEIKREDIIFVNVNGLTDTVGNLYATQINEMRPNIGFVAYTCYNNGRGFTLQLRTDEDVVELLTAAFEGIKAVFSGIKKTVDAS